MPAIVTADEAAELDCYFFVPSVNGPAIKVSPYPPAPLPPPGTEMSMKNGEPAGSAADSVT